MDFDAQPSSSSSSSSFSIVEAPVKMESGDEDLAVLEVNNQEPLTLDKINEGKKLKEESESENQIQEEVEMKSLIDQLPPEMLTEILEYLDAKTLVNCRLVSRKWNGVARKLIQSGDDVQIGFNCKKTEEGNLIIQGKIETASLENFIKYFEDSKDSPLYTRFRFDDIESFLFFDHADWLKFSSDFGKSVKSLRLVIKSDIKNPVDDLDIENHVDELVELVEKLKYLLMNQFSNLQEFGLHFLFSFGLIPFYFFQRPDIQLFPTTTTSQNQEKIQLAKLKVLYLDDLMYSKYTGIVTDLLCAAVNLKRVEPFTRNESYKSIETFQLLDSVGKLHCLHTATINPDARVVPGINRNSSLGFKLKKLHLLVSSNYNSKTSWSDISIFISHLFESSKDSLRELKMMPVGFLPALQLPEFSKLTRLSVVQEFCGQKVQVLPKGLEIKEIFPLLQNLELEMPWTDIFPHAESQNGNVSCLPNLKSLKITGREMTGETIARISEMCPKLKEFEIWDGKFGGPIENFPEVGEAIWTQLKQLEFLNVEISMDSLSNYFPAIDSTFTGFSGEDSIRLHNLIKNEQSAEKQGVKSELDAERKSPSILDLKDLKKLKVHRCFYDSDRGFILNLMSVSEKCAFKLMGNLEYEIN